MSNPYRHIGIGGPYYDDYDRSKNYVKMLYNPGYALQARELTQSQTYIQDQIAALGGYLFKDGSAVDGARISYTTKQYCLKIAQYDNDNSKVKPADFVGKKFRGSETGTERGNDILVTGYYIQDTDDGEVYWLLFSYMGGEIEPGETFTTFDEANRRHFISVRNSSSTSKDSIVQAMTATCTAGTIFIDGYLVNIDKPAENLIVALPSNDTTEYHIGFKITRKIVDANMDPSLHDPASGTYNYNAPGADRWQIKVELAAYTSENLPENDITGKVNYVDGIIVKGDTLIMDQDSGANGALMDLLAKRTYEESGSYTTVPWKIQLKENDSSDAHYDVHIEPGTGYIHGYRVSTLMSQKITVEKPRDYTTKKLNTTYIPETIYTFAQYEADGDTAYSRLALQAKFFPSFLTTETVKVMSGVGGTGDELGQCKITDIYAVGRDLRIYLTDVADVLGKFPSAKSLLSTSDPNTYVNLLTNASGHAEIYGTDSAKIIPTGYSMVTPAVQVSSDSTKISNPMNSSIGMSYTKTWKATSSTDKKYITFNTNADGASFQRDTLLYVYDANTGNHIDITNLDPEVVGQTVTIKHRNASFVFDGKEYIVCARTNITEGSIRTKTISDSNNVTIEYSKNDVENKIDVKTLPNTDIIEIVSITANGVDYTSKLVLDNGQTDYLYDYGSLSGFASLGLTAKTTFDVKYRYYTHGSGAGPFSAGSYVNTTNETYKTITQNRDFAEKHPDLYSAISTYRSKNTGVKYNLRDCLDFRVSVTELSWNASQAESGDQSTNGIHFFPSPRTLLSYDCGVYLPRIDAIWVDKNGKFGVTTGIPSLSPEIPEEKDGTMTIYYLYNSPYVNNLNEVSVQYVNNQRHTMKDITKLAERISNVENVVSMSLLEQSAVNMQVTDANGLNRYKTGIFADSFADFSNCDYTNKDWDCTIDAVECSIRPLFDCHELGFNFVETQASNSETTQVLKSGKILTLEPIQFSDKELEANADIYAENMAFSEATNIQSLMFHVWTGSATLNPSVDTWVNDLGQFVTSETSIDTPKPPTTYRTWSVTEVVDVNSSSTSSTSTSRRSANDGWGSYWTDTYRNTTTTVTATKETKTTTETTSYVGSWQTQNKYTQMESQDSFMRDRVVEFTLSGMRPGMTVKGTMDGVELSLVATSNQSGDPIISSAGTLTGTFKVPANMTVGTKLVEFFDSELTSAAATEYSANGKTVWTNVDRTYIRTWTSLVTTSTKTTTASEVVDKYTTSTKISSVYRNLDPIAESFYVSEPNGVVIDSIDLFFAKVDPNVNVEIVVVECENGYPGQNMVPFSRVSLSPSQVKCTPISSVGIGKRPEATTFKFESPLYLTPDTEYAFIVIAPSYNFELYTSTLGAADIFTGIGIKEQPYIGSMFKSQNLRTWTAEQLSDIMFRIRKCKFNPSLIGKALFDIKNPSATIVNSEGKPVSAIESAMQTIAVNSFIPNGTNVTYEYKWNKNTTSTSEIGWIPFNNKQDIFNTVLREVSNQNDNPSLQLRLTLSTEDENITPMIDLEQVYGIFTSNIVSNSDKNEFAYKCGTYLSNTVSLENQSSELRVILDAITPGGSDIAVYFKTSAYKPTYVNQAITGIFVDMEEAEKLIGKTLQVYYYNTQSSSFTLPQTSTQNLCAISGVKLDTDGKKRIYIKNISSPQEFVNATSTNTGQLQYPLLNNSNIGAICILPIISDKAISCPEWSAETKEYPAGSYVLRDNCMWQAQINTIPSNIPSELSIAWKKIPGITTITSVLEDTEIVWRPMTSNVTEKTSGMADSFTEYTYTPELEIETEFTDFSLRIDMYSQDKVNVPRFKNLRAISII